MALPDLDHLGRRAGQLIDRVEALVDRFGATLTRVDALLPEAVPAVDWKRASAARWRKRAGRGHLQPVAHPHTIALDALVAIDAQKAAIDANTRLVRRRAAGEQRAADRVARAPASPRW